MPSLHLSDFEGLFGEFASTYLASPEGQEHVNAYLQLRSAAEANWEAITRADKDGEDVTQQVLLKLLPWADTASNRQKGAWVHIAPAITGDLVSWFEGAGWTRHEDWPQIARAILAFVRRCTADTSELAAACAAFASLPYWQLAFDSVGAPQSTTASEIRWRSPNSHLPNGWTMRSAASFTLPL